ncbi:hypothetical protein [Achromobacter phage Motura]|uniref:Uncharacterized protein n=1 Tax=Achromobacter phage Motura TaxID=2591403 RepID=A0A514CT31_9CAUD|nr:hypothetical protein H1O15_gp163 [Achromobacter phage Motura]QDH83625.1 hypothetical protein [Achromobacter phage Motura]
MQIKAAVRLQASMGDITPAFRKGQADGDNGAARNDCPYPANSFDAEEWYHGWRNSAAGRNNPDPEELERWKNHAKRWS